MISPKTAFAIAAPLAAALALTGCGSGTSPYANNTEPAPAANAGITIKRIQEGSFFYALPSGIYKMTIPGKELGREKDVDCVLIKQTNSGYQWAAGYSGISCDFTPQP